MATKAPARPRSRSSTNSRSGARAELARFGAFCGELRIESGEPFKLHPFQKRILTGYFEGVRSTATIIPKKNGKSTLTAALALYHLLVTPNAECIIVAASRDQAEVVLRQARMFMRRSEPLQRRMRMSQRSILSEVDEGRIRVLAADADTADGVIPTLAIVDELHRHRTADLYGVLRDGLGPRLGQIVTISTAASTLDSPLGQIRTAAHETKGFVRRGAYNTVRTPTSVFHEWCLSPEWDTDDLQVVKKANPAPWNTVEQLRLRRDDGSMTPAQWLRFACGIWTESEEPWVEPHVWDGLAGSFSFADRAPVVVGVKVRGSTAAIVVVEKGTLRAQAHIFENPELIDLEAKCRDLNARLDVVAFAYDPRNFRRSAQLLEAEGLPMVEYPASLERIAQASGSLQRAIETKTLTHDGGADFRAQVLAGIWKSTDRGRYLSEDPVSKRSVDALIALASAVDVAGVPTKKRSVMVAYR